MHTVKKRENIKGFLNMELKLVLDSKDELIKIIESTNYAKDFKFVRASVSNEHAEIDLS